MLVWYMLWPFVRVCVYDCNKKLLKIKISSCKQCLTIVQGI